MIYKSSLVFTNYKKATILDILTCQKSSKITREGAPICVVNSVLYVYIYTFN